jgi:BolA protein
MARRDLIAERLTKAFAPASLEIVDESHQHVGHAGHREGGETHFRVYIVAEAFRGKGRLERHRMLTKRSSPSCRAGCMRLPFMLRRRAKTPLKIGAEQVRRESAP